MMSTKEIFDFSIKSHFNSEEIEDIMRLTHMDNTGYFFRKHNPILYARVEQFRNATRKYRDLVF